MLTQMQTPKHSILFAVALILCGCSKTQTQDQFKSKSLTLEDIISICQVDMQSSPPRKLEWSFINEKYVRCTVETSADSGKSWKQYHTINNSRKTTSGTFIYMLDHISGPSGSHYIVKVQIGGTAQIGGTIGAIQFSSKGSFEIPVDTTSFTATHKLNEPVDFLVIQSAAGWYRMRLESSNTPFPY